MSALNLKKKSSLTGNYLQPMRSEVSELMAGQNAQPDLFLLPSLSTIVTSTK